MDKKNDIFRRSVVFAAVPHLKQTFSREIFPALRKGGGEGLRQYVSTMKIRGRRFRGERVQVFVVPAMEVPS